MTPQRTPPKLVVGEWTAELHTGRLTAGEEVRAVEPKVMDLLFLLGSRPGEVFSREEVMAALWPGVTVGDDTLARSVSKLRKALGDEAGAARFIETIPKRGYRLIAAVGRAPSPAPPQRPIPGWMWALAVGVAAAAVLVVVLIRPAAAPKPTAAAQLTSRADDDYFQFTRADNEAAIELYQRALTVDPDDPHALAGMANAMVQQVVRWPDGAASPEVVHLDFGKALREGVTRRPAAARNLERARAMAERAVRAAPQDATAYKALGFVRSAQGDLEGAMGLYRRALALDPDAWGVMIDMADIHDIQGRPQAALGDLEQAYGAMTRAYGREPARVRPWQAALGVLIGDRHATAGRTREAQAWYRRVLAAEPFDKAATAGLAAALRKGGDTEAAARLCRELVERTGAAAGCATA